MRGRLAFALLPLVLSLLCLPAWAGTVREEDFGVSEVERSAAEQGGTAEYGAALDDGLAELVDTGTRELAGIVRRNGRIVIPSGGDMLEAGDDVIVVTTDTTLQDIHDIFA